MTASLRVCALLNAVDRCPKVQVAPLWFAAQFTFNVSLSETTVTSNTILASTSSLFTYALSCLLLLEAFVVSKLLFIALAMGGERLICHSLHVRNVSILASAPCEQLALAGTGITHHMVYCKYWADKALSVAGTIMVTYGDAKQGDSTQLNTVGGDLLVLLSGLCYAAYTVHPPPLSSPSSGRTHSSARATAGVHCSSWCRRPETTFFCTIGCSSVSPPELCASPSLLSERAAAVILNTLCGEGALHMGPHSPADFSQDNAAGRLLCDREAAVLFCGRARGDGDPLCCRSRFGRCCRRTTA